MSVNDASDMIDTGSSCRSTAASFRAIADQVISPEIRAKLLKLAKEWDVKAVEHEVRSLIFDRLKHP